MSRKWSEVRDEMLAKMTPEQRAEYEKRVEFLMSQGNTWKDLGFTDGELDEIAKLPLTDE